MTYLDDATDAVIRALGAMEEAEPVALANDLWEAGYLGLANDDEALQDLVDLWPRVTADETTVHQWADAEELVTSRLLGTIVQVRSAAVDDLRSRIKTALDSYEQE